MTPFERLLSKIVIDDKNCWNYTGAINGGGYGFFWYENANVYAHRASWEFHCDYIPEGQFVLHKCDNRRCINPNHLFLGTHKDNMNDMKAKGRTSNIKGDQHPSSLITEATAREIKTRLANGETKIQISKALQVSYHTVINIQTGKAWRHV